MVRKICETEALEGLGRRAADFRVVYETLKLRIYQSIHTRTAMGAAAQNASHRSMNVSGEMPQARVPDELTTALYSIDIRSNVRPAYQTGTHSNG